MTDDERDYLRVVIHELLYDCETGGYSPATHQLRVICKAAEESIPQAARICALEDALIEECTGELHRMDRGLCPGFGLSVWSRDPECPACQRLEALIGHRRPQGEA